MTRLNNNTFLWPLGFKRLFRSLSSAILLCSLPIGATALLIPNLGNAQTTEPLPPKILDGYLGVGIKANSRYVGAAASRAQLVPLLQFEYKQTYYIYLDRIGVRLWGSNDKKMALGIAAEPRFGFRAKDGARLSGMATRHDRIEGGPSFEWDLSAVSLDLAYFTDWTGAGGGQSLRLSLFRQLIDDNRWDIGAYTGFENDSAKTVRYYFGVRADEATPSRPYYQPESSLNPLVGFTGAYKFTNRYALMFGADATFLGSAAATSPIVERKRDLGGYFGVGFFF